MNTSPVDVPRDTCPFLKFPGHGCYCLGNQKMGIERVMRFCADDYLACRVFRDMLKNRNDSNPGVKNRKKSYEFASDQRQFTADPF